MDKKTQRCPYCQEAIYTNAIVCRYCRRDLPPNIPAAFRPKEPSWLPLLIGGAMVIGLGAILHSKAETETDKENDESDL